MTRADRARSDAELVAEILFAKQPEARENACRAILDRYWRVVVVLLQSRLSSARDAEDAAQDAFVRAWRSLDRLQNPRLFLGWLLRIAQNVATDHLRRRRPELSLDNLDPARVSRSAASWNVEAPIEEQIERWEEWEIVREALTKLPERYRTVVSLRYLQGLSNQEMALSLGEPEGTIRNRLFRALAKLRQVLKNQEASRT